MRAVYATVERVMRAADIQATAYAKDELLEALEAASTAVDKLVSMGDATRPAFAPWVGSLTFDWPTVNNGSAYRFWLNNFRLHSLTALVSGGVDVYADALPWPATGPAYSAIDIETSSSALLTIGTTGTGQRSLVASGTWGIVGQDRSRSTWTLGSSVGASDTTLTLNAPIGVGSIVLIDSERMFVSERSWADSGQTAAALTASLADQSVVVSTGSAFFVGEEIVIGGERMLIRDIVSNTLTVQRAASGSTLAAHGGASVVYWARACTVERAALGTSAAAHSSGAVISIYHAPALVEQLTVAYAIDQRSQEQVKYTRTLNHIRDRQLLGQHGSETGAIGVTAVEEKVISAYGRIRHRAV